jgi:hypothetical protein
MGSMRHPDLLSRLTGRALKDVCLHHRTSHYATDSSGLAGGRWHTGSSLHGVTAGDFYHIMYGSCRFPTRDSGLSARGKKPETACPAGFCDPADRHRPGAEVMRHARKFIRFSPFGLTLSRSRPTVTVRNHHY